MNPFEPPTVQDSTVASLPPGNRWRVLAVALYATGGFSLALGLFAAGVATWIFLSRRPSGTGFAEMMAGCTLYLGFGTAWIMAGRYFWTGRRRFGLIAALAGIAVPTCLFAILGF